MAGTTTVSAKRQIRDVMRKRRAALSPEERAGKSAAICSRLIPELDGGGTVMVYVSKPFEVSTRGLIRHLLAEGRELIVPIIERETVSLRLSYLRNPDVLTDSTFHVGEPIGNEIPARPSDVGTILLPLLAFDRQGNRLGYGAGYYDRFLGLIPAAKKIGLGFSCQQVEAVPSDPRDVRIDIVVTEDGVIRCS